MIQVQTIKTDGEDLVVMSRRDYDALLAQAGDEDAEDRMCVRIIEQSRGLTALPLEVWDRMEAGEPPLAVLMAHLGTTKNELARRTGLSEVRISELASGAVELSAEVRPLLAHALGVSPDVLEG